MKRLAWVCLTWLVAMPAHAYLIDLNDARTVAPGTMELELQPLGYGQSLLGEEEHYLIAPSQQYYIGLAQDWDVLYTCRGYVSLDDVPDQSPYVLAEQFVALRRVLVNGSYNDEELSGPSLALQMGAYIPGVEAETGFGASLAVLFAWRGEVGTIHGNVWFNYTQDETFDVFTSVAMEGPPAWPVRPTIEVYVDVNDGEPYVSGLLGAIGDVSDEFALQAGVRVGGTVDGEEEYADIEIRLSSWIYWEVIPQDEGEEEEEEEEEDEG
ncbi:MAG: hypothetical protein H6719_18525 [Sandaracinaceae bacterium]|nr:hypothetical protein [Sandaracinaceae bacterium]